MPIVYSKETETWELKDATQDEKEALIGIAVDVITDYFGEEVADQLISKSRTATTLAAIPKDEMGNA